MLQLIFLEILALLFLIYVIYLLSYSLIKGAPFAPLGKERIEIMFKLLNYKKGGKLVDLGSGDGRIVINTSKHGMSAVGFELNPFLALISKFKIRKLKLKNAKVYIKDYWKEDLSKFDYVTIYGTYHIMKGLEKKLLKELKPGAKVVSNHFKFPGWKEERMENDVWLYKKA